MNGNGLVFLLDQAGEALQQAYARIAQLEARVAELESGTPTDR